MTTLVTSIAIFTVTCLGIIRANGFDDWNDDSFKQSFIDVREDCMSDACLSMFPDKRGVEIEEAGNKPWPVTKVLASYHVSEGPWQMSCPCETRYDIIDLGSDHYPRYLATARCAPKSCHNKFNQCRLIRYKVHILRKRDVSIINEESEEQTAYVEQIVLPESLRLRWQMKPIKVPVACVAGDSAKERF